MELTVAAKDFAEALKHAIKFTGKDACAFVYVWVTDRITVMATDGHNVFVQKFSLPCPHQAEVCTALTATEARALIKAAPRRGLYDFDLPDRDGAPGVEMYNLITARRSEKPVDHVIPARGYAAPVDAFALAFGIFKGKKPQMRVYAYGVDGTIPLYVFKESVDGPEVWCMPLSSVLDDAYDYEDIWD